MKRLITIAATAACGMAIAVESANIVGYSTQSVASQKYNAIGVPFLAPGSENMKLSSLVPGTWDWESDELRSLTPANGGTAVSMFYVFPDQVGDFGVDAPGWYDGDGTCYNNEAYTLGKGFLTCLYSDVTFTSSGEVFQDAFAASFAGATKGEKYNIVPNAVPSTIKLSTIVPSAWDWESDELRILDSSTGGTAISLFYVFADQVGDFGVDAPGWYDSDGTCYNSTDVNAGEGFLSCLYSDVTFVFPAAL